MYIDDALGVLELETPIKPKTEWSEQKKEAFETIIQYFIDNHAYELQYKIVGNHRECRESEEL